MSLTEIREGLATAMAGIDGFQVSAYMLGQPTPPVIWVRPDPSEAIEYHKAMRNGREEWNMLVQAYVGVTSDVGAQKKLDALIESTGSSSVKAAIESDKTLGGVADDLIVTRCAAYQEYATQSGASVLGAEWSVLVTTSGT